MKPSWSVTVLKSKKQKALKRPDEAIKKVIEKPLDGWSLQEIIEKKKKLNTVCIVLSDATRPVPSRIILDTVVKELNSYGINDDQIFVLIATGLHRGSREEELDRIIGTNLKKRLKIVDHNANDMESLIYLDDTSDKVPIYINKHYYHSDLKILTGYVEPHFFFGFSGGRKSIVPGIAGAKTIQANHSAENIDSPYARFGINKENPMHKNATEIATVVSADFAINVCINENHEITKVAAGNFERVQQTLVEFQLKHVFKKISKPYDIVVCGNGGYPLDLNLYQAVKSMAIGEMAVKEGGTIISVNELSDGVGHDNFKELIFSGLTPKEIYDQIMKKEINVSDQWEIQILARILIKAEIYIVSKLNANEIGNIGLKHAKSVEDAIDMSLKKHGNSSKILILPNGPQMIPSLKFP